MAKHQADNIDSNEHKSAALAAMQRAFQFVRRTTVGKLAFQDVHVHSGFATLVAAFMRSVDEQDSLDEYEQLRKERRS